MIFFCFWHKCSLCAYCKLFQKLCFRSTSSPSNYPPLNKNLSFLQKGPQHSWGKISYISWIYIKNMFYIKKLTLVRQVKDRTTTVFGRRRRLLQKLMLAHQSGQARGLPRGAVLALNPNRYFYLLIFLFHYDFKFWNKPKGRPGPLYAAKTTPEKIIGRFSEL